MEQKMPETTRTITADDILPLEIYAQQRKSLRHNLLDIKRPRRIDVGPFASFYFENYATLQAQIQEMLYIEKGGEEQLEDEIEAYNPLIPQGAELVATLMFEIDDATRRNKILYQLGGVELTAYIEISAQENKASEKIIAVPEQDIERTTADGKTSSVHFLHFPFTQAQIDAFKQTGKQIILGIAHENYTHMTQLTQESRLSLAGDFA